FCKEVVKDPVLTVRERGNINEISVSPGRQLDHGYTFMTEHVCPVGALTTKDFRFKARVWFLRSAKSICQGCATGCNAWLDYDPRYQRAYRYRPRNNERVNQFWMCDEGMLSYRAVHENRLTLAKIGGSKTKLERATEKAAELIKNCPCEQTAILLSAQHSNEDNFALVSFAKTKGINALYLTGKKEGEGDDILRHADQNPNTVGAKLVAEKELGTFDDLLKGIEEGTIQHLVALGSAVGQDDVEATLRQLTTLVVVGSWVGPLSKQADVFLPACTWAEAHGLFVNAKGVVQESRKAIEPADDATPGWKLWSSLSRALGHESEWSKLKELRSAMPEAARTNPDDADEATHAASVES
ncbi:MAG: NADH-quinone oxidoreductase subunit G, partial [Sorangium cellulosum]